MSTCCRSAFRGSGCVTEWPTVMTDWTKAGPLSAQMVSHHSIPLYGLIKPTVALFKLVNIFFSATKMKIEL